MDVSLVRIQRTIWVRSEQIRFGCLPPAVEFSAVVTVVAARDSPAKQTEARNRQRFPKNTMQYQFR
jgi:hypothetical protein